MTTRTPRWCRFACMVATLVVSCAGLRSATGQSSRHDDHRGDIRFFDRYTFDESIPSPESFLGYPIGTHFTRHADQLAYLKTLARESDRVRYDRYGASHQRRELGVLTISAPSNLRRLDEILADNRALADPTTADDEARRIIENNPAIVWFSYNVHGNEPSPAECAIQMAYTFAAGQDDTIGEILDNVVLVIDPMLNPDGHTRYVSWYQDQLGVAPIVNPDATEHAEPWPGGRTNQYYFDLNRDWLWLTQPESATRLQIYRRYLPHLHVDHHEQGYGSPFFFGAGEEPYHVNIPRDTRDWVERYGRANARAFDAEGLVYSTAERFDYLYPGYGKVMPVYHGAVGMLAEKGGHSRAGLAIDVNETYTLTLGERTAHHFLLGMSNLELTAAERVAQLERFRSFFDPTGNAEMLGLAEVVIHHGNDPALLSKVWTLCAAHGIRIQRLDEAVEVSGLHGYRDGDEVEVPIALQPGAWILSTDQPLGRLVATMFERQTEIVDPDTYDITSWSVPVAFGLTAFYSPTPLGLKTSPMTEHAAPTGSITGDGDVATIIDSRQFRFSQAIRAATEHDVAGRLAGAEITVGERTFGIGSLIVHDVRNDAVTIARFLDDVRRSGLHAHRLGSGMTDDGPVLGANANRRFVAPRTLLVGGPPTSSNSYGQIWHLLDVAAPMPYTPVRAEHLSRIDLEAYNLIVLPHTSGNLGETFGERTIERLQRWVRDGGTIVALAGAADWAEQAILKLSGTSDSPSRPKSPKDDARPPLSELSYQERRERQVEDRVPGTVLSASIDQTHPLSGGSGAWIGVIKRGSRTLAVRPDGYVVARLDARPKIGGVMSKRNQTRVGGTPLMTDHRQGSGRVILLSEDVTFRGFQHASMRLLLNAVMFGPSL